MSTSTPAREHPDLPPSTPAAFQPPQQQDSFRRRAVFVVLLCVSAIVVLLLLWEARYILLLIFAACIGALFLTTLTTAFQSWFHQRRAIAFSLVIFALVAVTTLGIWFRGAALVQQFSALQFDVATAAQQLLSRLHAQQWARWVLSQPGAADPVSRGFSMLLSGIGGAVYLTASTVLGLLFVVITSLYLAAEPASYLRGIRRTLPASHREIIEKCFSAAVRILRSWIIAKLLSMVVVGAFVTGGLLLLRVPLPGTLGTIAAVLTFIPNLGPILSVFPAALLAFAISPVKGLLVIAWFGLAHFLEGNVVTPLAERSIVRLPPALTLTMQLLMASVAGFLGLALAAPLTAVILALSDVLLPTQGLDSPHSGRPPAPAEKSNTVIQNS